MKELRTKFIKSLSEYKLWLASFGLMLLIVAGTFSSIFTYLAFALAVVSIIFLSENNAMALIMFCMSFANIFKASTGAQSFFTYLILLFVLICVIRYGKFNSTFLCAMMIFVLFLLIQMPFSANILRTIKFIANIFIIYYVTILLDQKQYSKIFIAYVLGVIIASTIAASGLIPNLADFIGSKELGNMYGEEARFSGLYPDPNYYSTNVIISLCLLVILNFKKKLNAVVSIFLAVLLIAFSIMTFSKSAFLMLVLPTILLIYSKIKCKRYFLAVGITVFVVAVIVAVLSGKIEALEIVIARFKEADDLSSLTTGRSDIWLYYIEYLFDNPLVFFFGRGFGADMLGRAAHNTYIDLFYYLGLVGVVILVAVFILIIRQSQRSSKYNFLNFGIWICVACMYFFLSQMFYFDWAFHITIAILVAKMNMNPIAEVRK